MKRKRKKRNDEIERLARGQDRNEGRLGSGKLEQGRGKHRMPERSHRKRGQSYARARCAAASAGATAIAMMLVAVASIEAVVDVSIVGVINGIRVGHGDSIGWTPVSTAENNKLENQEFWRSRTFDIAWESGLDEAEVNLKSLSVEDFDKAEMQQMIMNAMDFGEAELIAWEPVPGGAEIQQIAGTPEFGGAMQVVSLEVKDLDEAERKQNERGLNVVEFDEARMKQISLSAMKLGEAERKQTAQEPEFGGADGAGNACRASAAVQAGNASANEASAIVAENANDAEAKRMAEDVEVQCQTSANVSDGTLDYVCSDEGYRLLKGHDMKATANVEQGRVSVVARHPCCDEDHRRSTPGIVELNEAGRKQISLSAMKVGEAERKQIAWEPGSGGAKANNDSLSAEQFGKAEVGHESRSGTIAEGGGQISRSGGVAEGEDQSSRSGGVAVGEGHVSRSGTIVEGGSHESRSGGVAE